MPAAVTDRLVVPAEVAERDRRTAREPLARGGWSNSAVVVEAVAVGKPALVVENGTHCWPPLEYVAREGRADTAEVY